MRMGIDMNVFIIMIFSIVFVFFILYLFFISIKLNLYLLEIFVRKSFMIFSNANKKIIPKPNKV